MSGPCLQFILINLENVKMVWNALIVCCKCVLFSIVNVCNPVSTDLQRQCNVQVGLNLGLLSAVVLSIDVPSIVLLFVKFKINT